MPPNSSVPAAGTRLSLRSCYVGDPSGDHESHSFTVIVYHRPNGTRKTMLYSAEFTLFSWKSFKGRIVWKIKSGGAHWDSDWYVLLHGSICVAWHSRTSTWLSYISEMGKLAVLAAAWETRTESCACRKYSKAVASSDALGVVCSIDNGSFFQQRLPSFSTVSPSCWQNRNKSDFPS